MLSGKQSDLDLMSTDVFTRFSQLILDLLSFLKMAYPVSAGQGFIHHFMGHWQQYITRSDMTSDQVLHCFLT